MITHDELMRYLDGELSPERARAVEVALEADTELRREYVLFQRMRSDLTELGRDMRMSTSLWEQVNGRLTRPLGWILIVAGLTVWLGWAVYLFVTGPEALWQKLMVGAVVVGVAMLFLSVVVDRLRDLKTDPYREIQR